MGKKHTSPTSKTFRVFIDGSHGTTGLELAERLMKVPAIKLIEIPHSRRKDDAMREKCYRESDVSVLCLPDEESIRVVPLIERIQQESKEKRPKILDTSTAFRTGSGWVYGHPQLRKEEIRKANRVSNPGCYAIGFITLVYPLIDEGLLLPSETITAFGISGYSGGGKKMIADHQKSSKPPPLLPYALGLEHKHIPEMQKLCGLSNPPLFLPMVGSYYRGMVVMLPLPYSRLVKKEVSSPVSLGNFLKKFYGNFYRERNIKVKLLKEAELYREQFLSPLIEETHDDLEIIISSRKGGDTMLFARFDNLGKGAAGNAVENIHLMLGLPSPRSLYPDQ